MTPSDIAQIALTTGPLDLAEILSSADRSDLWTALDLLSDRADAARLGSATRIACRAARNNLQNVICHLITSPTNKESV